MFLRHRSRKEFTQTSPKSLLKLVKIYDGIMTQTPHRSETNGVAERAVRRVKEVTAVAQVQSGLPEVWWECAMECCCYVHDKVADDKTAFEKRYCLKFDAP